MVRRLSVLILALIVLSANALADTGAPEEPIVGVWLTKNGTEVTIEPCEQGICGYVTKVSLPAEIYEQHKAEIDQIGVENLTDEMNKDPSLRSRKILGLQILTITEKHSEEKFGGTVYNPEDGNTYAGFLEIKGEDVVRLNGCVFYNLLCLGEDWERMEVDEVSAPPADAPKP